MKKNKLGVSLAELLAVVVIMGIIAAVAIPLVGNVIEETKKDALHGDAYTFAEAINLYCMLNEGQTGCNAYQAVNVLEIDGDFTDSNQPWHKPTTNLYSTASQQYNVIVSEGVAEHISKNFDQSEYFQAYTVNGPNNNGELFVRIRTNEDYQFVGYPLLGEEYYYTEHCSDLYDKSIVLDGISYTTYCLNENGSIDQTFKPQ